MELKRKTFNDYISDHLWHMNESIIAEKDEMDKVTHDS